MTVPALDTSKIGTFAYLRPATSIQLADALPYLHAYQQYSEYVDGVMRVWDTGSQSPEPNNYCDVYIRIRTDGWMMSFFPRNKDDPPLSHSVWTLEHYTNRGDLLWWGHTCEEDGNPPTNATRLGRALYELWEAVKTNSDNPLYSFNWDDVRYYDYEFPSAAKIYVFGRYWGSGTYYYFTVPSGNEVYSCVFNLGSDRYARIKLNGDLCWMNGEQFSVDGGEGFVVSIESKDLINLDGVQNEVEKYDTSMCNIATVIFAKE